MRLSLILVAAALSCARQAPPPLGQLVLHIDTDAPLPPGPGEPLLHAALFDTMRIEILADGRPIPGLSREFTVDEAMLRAQRASIGVLAEPGRRDLAARVRLFRYARQLDGQPEPRTSLDTTVLLPVVVADVVRHVAASLRTVDIGRAVGYPEPLETVAYANAPSAVGTWPLALRTPCAGTAREGEVCVPGGAYWFGGTHALASDDVLTLRAERLTVVTPFFIDATETIHGAFDALRAKDPTIPPSGGSEECQTAAELPVDCVPWEAARAACAARGMTLPTEAQWEWVASGLGAESEWPWGDEIPTCGDACFGGSAECSRRTFGRPALFPRDRVTPIAGGPSVYDLAGNVSEWMLDLAVPANLPPWSTLGVLRDPVGVGPAESHSERGARPLLHLVETRISIRRTNNDAGAVGVGFRCVRSAR